MSTNATLATLSLSLAPIRAALSTGGRPKSKFYQSDKLTADGPAPQPGIKKNRED